METSESVAQIIQCWIAGQFWFGNGMRGSGHGLSAGTERKCGRTEENGKIHKSWLSVLHLSWHLLPPSSVSLTLVLEHAEVVLKKCTCQLYENVAGNLANQSYVTGRRIRCELFDKYYWSDFLQHSHITDTLLFFLPNHFSIYQNQIQSPWRWRQCVPQECQKIHLQRAEIQKVINLKT